MTGSRITYWLATLIFVVGFPLCAFVFFFGNKPDPAGITEDWCTRMLPIPITVLVVSILSLYLGRNDAGSKASHARSWLLALVLMSFLMILLLFTTPPY